MNRFATIRRAVVTLLWACALIACRSGASIETVEWGNYAPFLRGDQSARLLSTFPFLKSAPIYHLRLDVNDDLSHIAGTETVLLTNSGDGAQTGVDFVLLPNIIPGTFTVESLSVDDTQSNPELSRDGMRLRVVFPHPLVPGGRVFIRIAYRLVLPRTSRVGFGGLESADGRVSLGYAYAMIPASGRWDYGRPPAFGDLTANPVSFYFVQVRSPSEFTVVAPGTEVTRTVDAGGRTVSIALGPSRDFFVQIRRDVRFVEKRAGRTLIRVAEAANPTDAQRSASNLVLDTASYAVSYYTGLLGAYPYRALTFVDAHFDAFGLEFPGIILLTSRLFADPDGRIDGVPVRALIEATVAHEVAHQWFYGLVGNNQLTEPWIDEALAQYLTYRYYEARYGDSSAQGFLHSLEARASRIPGPPPAFGGAVAAYSPKQYSSVIYGEAPLLIREFADRIGRERFDALLAALVDRYEWREVSGEEVKRLAEQTCACALDEEWDRWVAARPAGSQ